MKRRFRVSILLLAGILLLGAGLIGLTTVPDIMQYAFLPKTEKNQAQLPAPDSGEEGDSSPALQESTGKTLLEQYDKAMETMAEAFPKLTLHGVRTGVMLNTENGKSLNEITVYAAGPNWNAVYTPKIVKGRPIERLDTAEKSPVIVLDEETAFKLFGGTDPVGQYLTMDGKWLEVVGVAAHSRRIGETGKYAAWVPLEGVTDCSLMVLSVPANTVDRFPMFQTQAKGAFTEGTAISLAKEKARALMPLLLVFVVLAAWLLTRLIRWLTGYARIQLEKVKAENKRSYAGRLIPYAIGQMLPVILLFAGALAACYGVAVLAMKPMGIFPEWVPEMMGEYNSWISRFWELAGDAAKPVTMKTAELAEVQFWSGLILWGTLLILLRAAKKTLAGFGKKNTED